MWWCSIQPINLSKYNILEDDILVVCNHTMMGYMENNTQIYMHYMHRWYAQFHNFPGLILDQTWSDNFEAGHVHHWLFCSVDYYVEAYETRVQKNLWTHSETQHLPFFVGDILRCSISMYFDALDELEFILVSDNLEN